MPLYKKYFMHGTSHHLGIDVHDLGTRFEPIKAGMVFTCEPGIYIPEEGIGIRIENDVLITRNGNVDLMANIPVEAEEIEEETERFDSFLHSHQAQREPQKKPLEEAEGP